MTSTNGSEPVEPKAPRKRSAKTATSQDPEVLAAEIERTREDLAETLDAIAEKVSPKRVAGRTRKKVADKVSDVTEQVKEAAAGAKDKAVEQAGHAKEVAAGAKDKVVEQAGAAKQAATGGSARSGGGSERLEPADSTGPTSTGDLPPLPPVTGVQAEGLDLSTAPVAVATTTIPVTSPTDTAATAPVFPAPPPSAGSGVPREALAGGALGLLLLLLLRRRRTKKRAAAAVAGGALARAARRRT